MCRVLIGFVYLPSLLAGVQIANIHRVVHNHDDIVVTLWLVLTKESLMNPIPML